MMCGVCNGDRAKEKPVYVYEKKEEVFCDFHIDFIFEDLQCATIQWNRSVLECP